MKQSVINQSISNESIHDKYPEHNEPIRVKSLEHNEPIRVKSLEH